MTTIVIANAAAIMDTGQTVIPFPSRWDSGVEQIVTEHYVVQEGHVKTYETSGCTGCWHCEVCGAIGCDNLYWLKPGMKAHIIQFDCAKKQRGLMGKYRKKPIVIEATQFFYDREGVPGVFYPSKSEDGKTYIGDAFVVTIHDQRVYLENGDWIIMEPDGEHYYPCKPDIFANTYEAVES